MIDAPLRLAVRDAPFPDRDERAGGRWSSPDLLTRLLHLAALERAVAHVTFGWVPKIGELDEKLGLAATLEDGMSRASALRHHALTLLERDEQALVARPSWVAPLRVLDAGDDAGAVVRALGHDVRLELLERYEALASTLDPLFDARLLTTTRGAIAALRGETGFLPVPEGVATDGGAFAEALHRAWDDDSLEPVHLDDVVWSPQNRVPVPARPASRPRPEPGSMGHLRVGTRHDVHNIVGELNENVTAELCAMELMCRSSYEHPDMAWSFHLAAARHSTDESRHASIFRRLIAEHGVDESTLHQHGSNYEHAYAYPECEPGSKRELAWRMLLLCTILEALSIDKIPPEIATLDWLGQTDIARALDYISADELFHTEAGLKATRQLCADLHLEPMLERERVHGRFFARQLELRNRYLAADPERAAYEIDLLERDADGVPFSSRTETELRRRAGFTQDECDQVDRWGYNPRTA